MVGRPLLSKGLEQPAAAALRLPRGVGGRAEQQEGPNLSPVPPDPRGQAPKPLSLGRAADLALGSPAGLGMGHPGCAWQAAILGASALWSKQRDLLAADEAAVGREGWGTRPTLAWAGGSDLSAAPSTPAPPPPPRARPRRAAPSAAPVASVANTCTSCNDTWLTGGSTTGTASGRACARARVYTRTFVSTRVCRAACARVHLCTFAGVCATAPVRERTYVHVCEPLCADRHRCLLGF